MSYYRIFAKIYERAAQKMCLDCQGFIQKGSKILDLGCGSGIIGMTFQDFFQAEVIGVDIKDNRIFPISFKIINGKSLPFPENSFDVVLINYVLHHSGDPTLLLKEAKRVTRGKIIVYEDLPEGLLSGIFCKIHGISFDKIFKNPNQTSFKSEREWEEIFKKIGLNIIFKRRKSNFPVKKELFILGD
jgi:ubiquinone/menaquinone biosynthesis C-methylase UbiE